ncbi:MAG: hypothetical protein NT123_24035 [Proteobacteria bacterium]|nr:hypothetical protein [Pseudomonadota bacterium]
MSDPIIAELLDEVVLDPNLLVFSGGKARGCVRRLRRILRGRILASSIDGNEAHGLRVVADRVLTVYAAGKVRKAARDSDDVPA